jgi:hypothetical protein
MIDGWVFQEAVDYALVRMSEHVRRPRLRELREGLAVEDVATAYAMACALGAARRGHFWAWAKMAGYAEEATRHG